MDNSTASIMLTLPMNIGHRIVASFNQIWVKGLRFEACFARWRRQIRDTKSMRDEKKISVDEEIILADWATRHLRKGQDSSWAADVVTRL
jgi:hypothetical protein